jgi:hypothetical protein
MESTIRVQSEISTSNSHFWVFSSLPPSLLNTKKCTFSTPPFLYFHEQEILLVQVFHKTTFSKEPLGKATLRLDALQNGKEETNSLKLEGVKSGEVLIATTLTWNEGSVPSSPVASSCLFPSRSPSSFLFFFGQNTFAQVLTRNIAFITGEETPKKEKKEKKSKKNVLEPETPKKDSEKRTPSKKNLAEEFAAKVAEENLKKAEQIAEVFIFFILFFGLLLFGQETKKKLEKDASQILNPVEIQAKLEQDRKKRLNNEVVLRLICGRNLVSKDANGQLSSFFTFTLTRSPLFEGLSDPYCLIETKSGSKAKSIVRT